MFIFLVCMSLALLDSTQSISFETSYYTGQFGILDSQYICYVQYFVSITSIDTATVEKISGQHKSGYGNDNVEVFYVFSKGQIHYFPRGLNKFFKNLKGILIDYAGMKEIRQNDLKQFPQLRYLYLQGNQLEVLEENLFEFNPNLEGIYLTANKISYIHPKVFDKLTKLKTLWLLSNTCIDMAASNSTEVQNVIRTAKAQCTNSEYSNLEQKVKNLEIDSKTLNSENFEENLQNLENEIKNSKFPNFFQEKLQDLKTFQVQKAEEERLSTTTSTAAPKKVETCSTLESKFTNLVASLKDLMAQAPEGTDSNKTDEAINHSVQCSAIKEGMANFTATMDTRLEILEENVENLKSFSMREISQIKTDVKAAHYGLLRSFNTKVDKIEEKLAKIMKALNIDD